MHELLKKARALGEKAVGLDAKDALRAAKEADMFALLTVTDAIRRFHKGVEINLCGIVNAKSGLCKEDCSFCAQSAKYLANSPEYPMLSSDEIAEKAMEAARGGAREFSIVTSGTKVSKGSDVEKLRGAIKKINTETGLESCASLGIMDEETLLSLKEAGLHSYHHNLETSRSFFPKVCTTHAYDEDLDTIKRAKKLGFYVCSGGIFGLGESWDDRVELAVTLKDAGTDCVPINFLNPRPGTPLEGAKNLTPEECLRIIALFRLMMPANDIIVCGGRQVNLKTLQPLIFAAGANGMMVGNYLTTKGSPVEDDMAMLKDLGLRPRGK
ncbi:MAG: biotin synthase BioB [Deltaproteobacteria bacterium]|nr:biotin synthase BioB [Deltaproteobacteria bacterium]